MPTLLTCRATAWQGEALVFAACDHSGKIDNKSAQESECVLQQEPEAKYAFETMKRVEKLRQIRVDIALQNAQ